MKRSLINAYLREADKAFAAAGFALPPFAHFPADKWDTLGDEYDEIRTRMLGWDITDFGSGDFEKLGLLLFTLRNGDPTNPSAKTYAEKLMLVRQNQVTPMHFHWKKMEDIICRTALRPGASLAVQVYLSDENEGLSKEDVPVQLDGFHTIVPAGTVLHLEPGQSITMTRGLYHTFWSEGGDCIVGEVSMSNDDTADNRFLTPTGRFADVEEDEAPLWRLCNEYGK